MNRVSLIKQLVIGLSAVVVLNTVSVTLAYVAVARQRSIHFTGGLAWSLTALGLAVLLGFAALLWLLHTLILPLRSVADTVSKLAGGDLAARVPVTGSPEFRQVANAINAQAESAERMREQEAERNRLQLMARQTVRQIRAHLRVEDVMREARVAIEEEIDADAAYLHVIREDQIGRVHAAEEAWVLPADFVVNLPDEAMAILHDLLARRTSMVIQDVQGPEGNRLAPQMREPMRAAGIVSHLLTPVGEGDELLAVIAAERMRPGHPWTPDEVEAVEWIAADLARGLQQARMYEAENRLVDELREVNQAKSDFLASISHELRTPLTSIAGFVELLDDQAPGPLNPEQQHMMKAVKRNTVRLRHLIEDLLTLSKIESGTFETALEPVNLADVVTSGAAALQVQAEGKGLALATATGLASILVNGDPVQLERILLNLLSNAVKFTPAGGKIKVTAAVQGAHAILEVADTGIGIPEDDQKDLSSRFFRASNATKQAIPGTGLGLTIVGPSLKTMTGRWTCGPREGEGTTVTIRIPLLATAAAGPAGRAAGDAGSPSPAGH